MNNRNLPRQALATGLAACAHLLVLLLMGWKVPRLAVAGPAEDRTGAVEITLFRPAARPRGRSSTATTTSSQPATRPAARVLTAPTPGAPVLSAPTPAAPGAAVAQGPPDCEPEDLPLLTEAEKARCRNAIDADRARPQARGADERLAKQVAGLKAVPRIESIPANKRAYYDAVAAAYEQQNHGPPMAGHLPGIACGPKTPYHSLKLGPLPCAITPPQGFLTEEAVIPPP